MTSDFSEAGEQAEGYLAMYEFSRLEDKAVKAAATGRAGRAGITSPPSLRARNNSARRGTEPRSLPAAPAAPAPRPQPGSRQLRLPPTTTHPEKLANTLIHSRRRGIMPQIPS